MSHIIQINAPFARQTFPPELPPELMGRIADCLSPKERIALANTCKQMKNLQGVILSPPQRLLKEIHAREIELENRNNYDHACTSTVAVTTLFFGVFNMGMLTPGSGCYDARCMSHAVCAIVGIVGFILLSCDFRERTYIRDMLWRAERSSLEQTLRMLRLQEPERIRRGRLSSSVTISIQEEKTPDENTSLVASAPPRQSYGS